MIGFVFVKSSGGSCLYYGGGFYSVLYGGYYVGGYGFFYCGGLYKNFGLGNCYGIYK